MVRKGSSVRVRQEGFEFCLETKGFHATVGLIRDEGLGTIRHISAVVCVKNVP